MNKIIRNLSIFSVVTLSAGFVGLALDQAAPSGDPQPGLGILLWLVAPPGGRAAAARVWR